MSRTERSGSAVSTRRVRRSAAVALVATAMVTGCAAFGALPQSVVWAPGNYTFGIPSNFPFATNPAWGPAGTIGICTDTESVLYVQANYSGPEVVHLTDWAPFDGSPPPPFYSLWNRYGQDMDGSFRGFPEYLSTNVALPPGCGKLAWATYGNEGSPYPGPPTVTVSITKTTPTP